MFNSIISDTKQYLEQFNYVQKMNVGLLKNFIKKVCLQIIHI